MSGGALTISAMGYWVTDLKTDVQTTALSFVEPLSKARNPISSRWRCIPADPALWPQLPNWDMQNKKNVHVVL